MDTHATPAEIGRRFTCASTNKASENAINREAIAAQIAEFERRGGTINKIAIGVSALAPGELLVSPDKESMSTPRLSEAGKKAAKRRNNTPAKAEQAEGLILLGAAAKMLGISTGTISKWITKGILRIVTDAGASSRGKFLKKAEVIAVKNSRELNKSIEKKTLINMKQAANILGVHPVTVSKWVKSAALKIEKVDLIGKHSKLLKTSDVLALKETLQQGKKQK